MFLPPGGDSEASKGAAEQAWPLHDSGKELETMT